MYKEGTTDLELKSGRIGTINLRVKSRAMIEYRIGNILEANTEALVNTVNCVGVMGRGIALQFGFFRVALRLASGLNG